MYSALKVFFFIAFFSHLFSCQDNGLPVIEQTETNNIKEVKLGESNYYLKLPNGFELYEAKGKEGQLGYGINSSDSITGMHGFVEIEPGNPIGGRYQDGEGSEKYKRSNFLNTMVTWKIYQTETKWFIAYTKKGDISAEASAKNKDEIDSLIGIIATLRTK